MSDKAAELCFVYSVTEETSLSTTATVPQIVYVCGTTV